MKQGRGNNQLVLHYYKTVPANNFFFALLFQGGSVLNQIIHTRLIAEILLGFPFFVSVSKLRNTELRNIFTEKN